MEVNYIKILEELSEEYNIPIKDLQNKFEQTKKILEHRLKINNMRSKPSAIANTAIRRIMYDIIVKRSTKRPTKGVTK